MVRVGALFLLLTAACGAPQPLASAPPDNSAIHLRGDAFVADTAFLFPEVATEVSRGLMRAEFTLREAARLGIEADLSEVERSLDELRTAVLAEVEATAGEPASDEAQEQAHLDGWAFDRYGLPWRDVRAAFEQRLRRNQLYQMVLRADGHRVGGYQLLWFVCRTEAEAAALAEKLRLGADPAVLMTQTALPDTPLGGEPVAAYLPAPFKELLEGKPRKSIVGPARMAGDQSWRVAQLLEVRTPGPIPGRAELLEGLREQPVGGVEARAWFEEMSRRYTAEAGPLPVSSPDSAVEHSRRSS